MCPEPYCKPTRKNAHKVNVHLTNYSLAKYDANFEHADDPHDGTSGTKRALSAVLPVLESEGHDAAVIWERLRDTCAGVGVEMAWAARAAARAGQAAYKDNDLLKGFATDKREPDIEVEAIQHQSFHIVGVDVLLDAGGFPHLLEVNNNPSFCIDSVFPIEGK